ncbi:rRNA methyltransferase 2, mitochondrial [Aplysia californica]|uniref:rRNA methyltransferase 2, mitochondrial n=1 Tax=Aplysia californica TaxID=6500 RepID=A0ABM0JCX7_APLCA|nr:rRNA methyltransferase 2, mitochondrial [Aplysia californica]
MSIPSTLTTSFLSANNTRRRQACLVVSKFLHLSHAFYKKGQRSSSNQWLERQRRDPFVKQAGKENYRCRSAFKLLQIDDKYGILKPGQVVIDCGAAPGSWCQAAVQKVNSLNQDSSQPQGMVIGIDLQHIAPLDGAITLSGCDFTSPDTYDKVSSILQERRVDILLSDMAPSATGIKSHNHELIVGLCFSVLRFSLAVLKPGGTMLCKLWQGGSQDRLAAAMRTVFQDVRVVKPEASRDDSAEVFMMGRGFKSKKSDAGS